jgi:sugar phosphate isomerase/epimerase
MTNRIARRGFLQTAGTLTAGLGLLGLSGKPLLADEPGKGAPNAEKLGWRLGCQAYSFNKFTFYEAIDKNASIGLHYIEAYPGQKLSAEKPDVKVGDGMSADVRGEVKRRLADKGVKLVNFGVVGLWDPKAKDDKAPRKIFDFARDMGIETIVSEPPPEAFDTLDRLCEEYQINIALHNHPEPSFYWNYQTVLDACKGHSKRIGACADTGHWMRSGINPLDAIKALEGHIISFHFKDLDAYGRSGHDVPWGTGKADVKALLAEIYRQKIKAVFSIEYEYNWLNSLPEIAQGVEYFDKVAAELAQGK